MEGCRWLSLGKPAVLGRAIIHPLNKSTSKACCKPGPVLKQRNKAASDSKLLSDQAGYKSAGDYKAGWEMLKLGSAHEP